jgi:membrane protein implicated in regulation of membrane protease activity
MAEYMLFVWFAIIIIAAFIESQTMDLTSLWFSVGSLFALIIAIIDNDNILLQTIVFLVVSFILIATVRPIAKNYFKTNIISTNSDRLIGKIAVCTKEITIGERGEVKIDGKYWMAVTSGEEDINTGDKVEVLAIEGVKLIVVKL